MDRLMEGQMDRWMEKPLKGCRSILRILGQDRSYVWGSPSSRPFPVTPISMTPLCLLPSRITLAWTTLPSLPAAPLVLLHIYSPCLLYSDTTQCALCMPWSSAQHREHRWVRQGHPVVRVATQLRPLGTELTATLAVGQRGWGGSVTEAAQPGFHE